MVKFWEGGTIFKSEYRRVGWEAVGLLTFSDSQCEPMYRWINMKLDVASLKMKEKGTYDTFFFFQYVFKHCYNLHNYHVPDSSGLLFLNVLFTIFLFFILIFKNVKKYVFI